jgi:hypothetical protein
MVERLIEDGKRILKRGGYYVFQIPLASKHKCVPCNDAHAVDMVYWTREEVLDLAKQFQFKVIHEPRDTQDQFFIFQK